MRWNPQLCRMLGVDECPAVSQWQAYLQSVPGHDRSAYTRLMTGDINEVRECLKLARTDGEVVWMDLSTVLIRDAAGDAVRLQSIARDVTDQVVAEHRVAAHSARQEALLELSRVGMRGGDLPTILARSARVIAAGVAADLGSVLEYLHGEQVFVGVASDETGSTADLQTFPARGSSLAMKAYTADRPITATFDETPGPRDSWITDPRVRASLACAVDGRPLDFGVLGVHWFVPRVVSIDEVEFLRVAAGILSVAIERQRSEDQRSLLLGRLVQAQEHERKAIAIDIHDDAVQVMTAANLRLEVFKRGLTDEVQIALADHLQSAVSMSTTRLRKLLFDLSPPGLEQGGLAAAVRLQLDRVAAESGLKCTLHSEGDDQLSVELRTLMYRIFQEAVTNVRKHAAPSSLAVALASVDGGVQMTVKDDGLGFSVAEASLPTAGHIGLESMRERATLGGGWWRIDSNPGAGTVVTAWLPVAAPSIQRGD